jgi:cysteine-rich repeat protein
MRFNLTRSLRWLAVAALATGCADATDTPDVPVDNDPPVFAGVGVKADGFALAPEGYEAEAILRAANTLSLAQLDDDAALDARAARNIVAARDANGPFDSVIALDDVPYVGQRAFAQLLSYAERHGWIGHCGDGVINGGEACDGGADCDASCGLDAAGGPTGVFVHGVEEGTYAALGLLAAANTLDHATLDDAVGLDARAAQAIVDDRPFANLADLDAASYVGERAFGKLGAYAADHGLVPACGDGVVQAGLETCDDGNTADGDGCDATCGGEVATPPPADGYDTPVVHGVHEGTYAALGILRAANQSDLPTLDDVIDLDVRAAKAIYYGRQANGEFGSLADLDAASYVGADAFEKLLAYAETNALLPTCGDGVVQPVEETCDGTPGCDATCERTFHCGEGVVEGGEQCDDGNADADDGCSSLCQWEIARSDGSNRSYETALEIGTYTHFTGNFSARSGHHYWKFTIDRPSRVSIDLMGYSRNEPITRAQFEAGAVPGAPNQGDGWSIGEHGVPGAFHQNIAFWRWYWDPRCSSSGCSLPDYNSVKKYQKLDGPDYTQQLAPGTYYIGFHTGAGNSNYSPSMSYLGRLIIEPTGDICGNGVVDDGEACDDGNMIDGDGCTRACDLETRTESERNDDLESADPLDAFRLVNGTNTAGDADWFVFRVADGWLDARLRGTCPFDATFALYDEAGDLVAEDDDGAGGYCPALALEGLSEGYYYLRIAHADARIAGGGYLIDIQR